MDAFLIADLIFNRIRGFVYSLFVRRRLKSVGRGLKWYGGSFISVAGNLSLGDGCWIQAVPRYKNKAYLPSLVIGEGVSCSDNVHISCVHDIKIGDGALIGSNVYIGDHSHGSAKAGFVLLEMRPADRDLSDIDCISIGRNVWICDGVVILAGSVIPDGSIVGANSVVKGVFSGPSVIAGSPARVIRAIDL
jgi:acetyltransferase-like isoleucine patch superfamily enzyme